MGAWPAERSEPDALGLLRRGTLVVLAVEIVMLTLSGIWRPSTVGPRPRGHERWIYA
jgi:hypothetical protein